MTRLPLPPGRALAAAVAALVLCTAAPAADLAAAVREAVEARQVLDSELRGDPTARTPFRGAAADGGVLVGLEVAAGRDGVCGVRPLYRAGAREWAGPAAGNFLAREADRRVRLVARPEYAVGGLAFNAGAGRLDGLAVVFMRVKGARLDPADQYDSPWAGVAPTVGDRVDGAGRPVVGVFGRLADDRVAAFGLTYADLPGPADPADDANRLSGTAANDSRGGLSKWLIGLVAFGLVTVPLGLVGYFVFGKKKEVEEEIAIIQPSVYDPPAGNAGAPTESGAADGTIPPDPHEVSGGSSPAVVELAMR